MDVIFQSLFGKIGYLFGYVLSVYLYGFSGHRVLDQIEFVALFLKIECLDRKELVGIEHRYLLLVVHVSSGEVERRQVGGKCLILLVACRTYLLGSAAQILVVGKGEVAALREGEDRTVGDSLIGCLCYCRKHDGTYGGNYCKSQSHIGNCK